MASTMGLYLMKQFMESSVPDTVLESARLDGASEFRTFLIIAMPMVKPAWLTLIIETFRNLWNSGSSIYIQSEQLKSFNYAIQQIITGGIQRSGAGAASTFAAASAAAFAAAFFSAPLVMAWKALPMSQTKRIRMVSMMNTTAIPIIASIVRKGAIITPIGETEIEENDRMVIIANAKMQITEIEDII